MWCQSAKEFFFFLSKIIVGTLLFGMLRYFANLIKSLNSKFRPYVFPNSYVDSELVPKFYVFCQVLFFMTNI